MKIKSKSMDELSNTKSSSTSTIIMSSNRQFSRGRSSSRNPNTNTSTSRSRIYETAFDCKISKSNDDLDEIDRINNHAILLNIHNNDFIRTTTSSSSSTRTIITSNNSPINTIGTTMVDPTIPIITSSSSSSFNQHKRYLTKFIENHQQQQQQINSKQINNSINNNNNNRTIITGVNNNNTSIFNDNNKNTIEKCTNLSDKNLILTKNIHKNEPLPSVVPLLKHPKAISIVAATETVIETPSTSPLPFKFLRKNGKHLLYVNDDDAHLHHHHHQVQCNNSNSTPNLINVTPLKDSKKYCPNKSSFIKNSTDNIVDDHNGDNEDDDDDDDDVSNIYNCNVNTSKGEQISKPAQQSRNEIIKGNNNINNTRFLSNESLTFTSSHGNSMDSLRSIISDGNRSTTSFESHQSTTWSSHSSTDSSSYKSVYPLRILAVMHSKLHILSPISDKSIQEPLSSSSAQIGADQTGITTPTTMVTTTKTNINTIPDTNIITTMATIEHKNSDCDLTSQLPPSSSSSLSSSSATTLLLENSTNNNNNNNNTFKTSRRRLLQNKNLKMLAEKEIQGSDSGISLQSREGSSSSNSNQSSSQNTTNLIIKNTEKYLATNSGSNLNNDDLYDLPFDMPKLRRRKLAEQNRCASSAIMQTTSSVADLGAAITNNTVDLPTKFNSIKPRFFNQENIISCVNTKKLFNDTIINGNGDDEGDGDDDRRDGCGPNIINDRAFTIPDSASFHNNNNTKKIMPNFLQTINNNNNSNQSDPNSDEKFSKNKGLRLNLTTAFSNVYNRNNNDIDLKLPLEKQSWFHGAISRLEAENILGTLTEGSYLLRTFKLNKNDYSISLKCAKGFLHIKIQCNQDGKYLLGQFGQPFDSILEMIQFYSLNRLPVRGAEHLCLLEPVTDQLL